MDFDTFLGQAWTDHAADAPAVAARLLTGGPGLVSTEAQIVPMAHLAHHVLGEHLARWHEGVQFQQQLAALPCAAIDSAATQALRRYTASLRLCGGVADERGSFAANERIRITALAAANLAGHDAQRATALLEEALAQADGAALADADPAHRALAIAGNGIAGTLEEKSDRSADERLLMIHGAQVARRYWALAGTWLETERAEYRLAKTWLQAGDPVQARQHARQCLQIVQANQGAALEQFFAWDALGLVERAAGNAAGHAQALAQAHTAFAGLGDADRPWCQPSLDKLTSG